MRDVTTETVRERMNELGQRISSGRISLREEFELACLRELLACRKRAMDDALLATANASIPMISYRWIPVSERMPEYFEAVIAFDGDQVYGEAMYSLDDGFTVDGYDPCDRLKLQNVTHWMPLPAAPQEVK